MDFTTLRTQVIELLQREQRLSYRALKRQFSLDDEDLEALKDELLYAKRLAVDEDGRVLVWTGGTSSTPPTASPVPLPATPAISPAQGEAAPVVPSTPDAERRQLTVMFCDLVDSTKLSSQLDPEEYRDVVRQYQRVCTDVIQRYDGHIAQLLGDGLLIYFGYPQAHEDDAHRAVRTGLGILAVMDDLNKELKQTKGLHLAIRLGIHTGLVVVGAMGGEAREEQLALGETPNIAARLQGLAAPNTLVISDATYRLVQGYFACQDLGAQALRGVTEAMRLYHVLGESGATNRLEVAQPRGLTPLVGRESEVTLLQERWAQARRGQGQVVLLTGDAGIGKSRLVQMLKDHIASEQHVRWECRSAEYYQNTVLYPLIELFQRLWQFEAQEPPEAKWAQLEHALSQYRLPLEESLQLFVPLFSLPLPENRYPPLNLSPQRQRQKTLESLVAILLELAERQPVLFIVEDLHWTDPTTLEFLNLLIEQTPTTAMLVLLTCRPHFQPAWHHRSYITEMTLHHLSHTQVAQIVTGMTDGKTFPHEVLAQIVEKTDGVPLFVEEMTKAILESEQLTTVDGHYELAGALSTLAIPTTLQDSLLARLDRLVTAKGVAQMGATIGRQFAYDLLRALSQLDEVTLQRELGRLVEAEIVFQRGVPPQAMYTFKHALIQDAAYQSLLRSTRQQYHQRIALVLKAQFPAIVDQQPELLAHHYTEAGLLPQALPYWQRAGQRALERSAPAEAISHLRQGLTLLQTLPETPERVQHELTLHLALGPALMATQGQGAPEVGQAYARARALCQQGGENPQVFPMLFGLWRFYVVQAEHQTAREVAEQSLSLAQRAHDPALLLPAHLMLGASCYHLGEVAAARPHLEQGLALYDPQEHRPLAFRYGMDLEVWCLSYLAFPLWLLGYPDQALQRSREARTLARDLAHPFSLAATLVYGSLIHSWRREGPMTREQAEAAMALAREQGFPQWVALGTVQRGWALAEQGLGAEGIAQMHQGLAAFRATGSEIARPWFLARLAEAYGKGGQTEEGLHTVAEARAHVHAHGEHMCEAELYRLQGTLTLQSEVQGLQSKGEEAEECFQRAIAITRQQQAKSLELRAATSLARLWQQQGKRAAAYELLAPIYGWFTEGFDTADLQEARALLDALA
jgi:predicted ATPase/class 3 adenylate cyclase